MNLIKDLGVRKEGAETGFGAQVDRAAAIFGAREVRGVCVAEDPPAKGHEARMLLCQRKCLHEIRAGPLHHFCNEDLKRTDRQSLGRFGRLQSLGARKKDLQVVSLHFSGT